MPWFAGVKRGVLPKAQHLEKGKRPAQKNRSY